MAPDLPSRLRACADGSLLDPALLREAAEALEGPLPLPTLPTFPPGSEEVRRPLWLRWLPGEGAPELLRYRAWAVYVVVEGALRAGGSPSPCLGDWSDYDLRDSIADDLLRLCERAGVERALARSLDECEAELAAARAELRALAPAPPPTASEVDLALLSRAAEAAAGRLGPAAGAFVERCSALLQATAPDLRPVLLEAVALQLQVARLACRGPHREVDELLRALRREAAPPEPVRVRGPGGLVGTITRDVDPLTVDVRWDGARTPTVVLRSCLEVAPS